MAKNANYLCNLGSSDSNFYCLKPVCGDLLAQHGSKVVWKTSCGTWVGSSVSHKWLWWCGRTKQSISKCAAVTWPEMVGIGPFWGLGEGRGDRGESCNAISCCWLYFHSHVAQLTLSVNLERIKRPLLGGAGTSPWLMQDSLGLKKSNCRMCEATFDLPAEYVIFALILRNIWGGEKKNSWGLPCCSLMEIPC